MKTSFRSSRLSLSICPARICLWIAAVISLPGNAMEPQGERLLHRDSIGIFYRQSKIEIDTTYMSNSASMAGIERLLTLAGDSARDYRLTGVEVVGAASPEGSLRFNRWLSGRRAERVFELVRTRVSLPDSLATFTFRGRDWGELYAKACADPGVPYRSEALRLLKEISSATSGGESHESGYLARLKSLRGGVPYRYLYRHVFPYLRQGHVILSYEAPALPAPPMEDTVERPVTMIPVVTPDTVYVTVRDTVYIEYCPPCRPFYMNIRTNGLYDLAAIPNIGVEFYLAKGWSVGANWQYAWWSSDRRHRYWRAYGGDLNVRKWFGHAAKEKPLTGHHVGVYGQVLTYDFEFGGKGHIGGKPGGTLWDRCLWGAGLEYGYSLPIARRINIDFSLGLGVLTGKVVTYRPGQHDNYYWTSVKRTTWLGPTKAEIALVWQIGCDNVNAIRRKAEKGGLK